MARNKSESSEEGPSTGSSRPRQTASQQMQNFTKSTQQALKKAADSEKYRYKSPRNDDTSRFIFYLRNKLEIWDEMKDKTFHATRMYEKTRDLLNALE
tara:strand:- start:4028 stop:4321 length:294 start_codon:yes stop_codon:yes gene_type:complete